jgi:hypothetical protein
MEWKKEGKGNVPPTTDLHGREEKRLASKGNIEGK